MAKITRVPSPGPDDPIFREGFRLTSARMSTGAARSAVSDADRESADKEDESADEAGENDSPEGPGK